MREPRRNRDPLDIVNEHIARHAKSAATFRARGIETGMHRRHDQIRALNAVRREIMGRPH